MITTHAIQVAAVMVPPIIFSIILHEVAHGWAAEKLGDGTARSLGRLTLNPLPHIDLIGTILLPLSIIFLLQRPILFGWAKPVPVNFRNLRHPKRDMIYVAGAGPVTNLILALISAMIYTLLVSLYPPLKVVFQVFISTYKILPVGEGSLILSVFTPLVLMAGTGVVINVALMLFNLIPLPPLDGGRIMVGLLPPKKAMALARIEPYGFFILIFLIMSGALNYTLWPLFDSILNILLG